MAPIPAQQVVTGFSCNGYCEKVGEASASCLIRSAMRSATMMVEIFVLAQGIDGITDASHTRRPSTPCTRPVGEGGACRVSLGGEWSLLYCNNPAD
jgi:hypothetical protein